MIFNEQSSFTGPTDKSHYILVFFIFFISLVNGFQILEIPYIGLAEGLGYDGSWYLQSTFEFLPKTDNYHIFRILPATLVFILKEIFDFGPSIHESVRMFQFFNLGCILFSCVFTELISRRLNFRRADKFIFYCFLYLNFHVLKDSVYNPVMTDSLVFCLALGLFYTTLENKKILFSFLALLAFFTLPFLSFFFIGERILRQIDNHFLGKTPKLNLSLILSILVPALFFIGTCFIVYGMGRYTLLTFPDKISPYLFPISIILLCICLYFLINLHKNLINDLVLSFGDWRKYLVWESFFLLFLIVLQFGLSKINNFAPKGFIGNFTLSPPLYMTLKPLIGLFDNIMFFGLPVILFLFFLPKFINLVNHRVSILFITFFLCLFLLKPEARHTILFLPFLVSIVMLFFKRIQFSRMECLAIFFIGIFFSKVWYPVQLSWFPSAYKIFTSEVNHDSFQEFPAQHYFMFQGPMISHVNYSIWLIFIGLGVLFVWKILAKHHLLNYKK